MEDLDKIKADLSQIPWCARLLEEPGVVVELPRGKISQEAGREESLMLETLRTHDTIINFIDLYNPSLDPKDSPVREVKGILVVGEGVNGFMHTLHGGIVATISNT